MRRFRFPSSALAALFCITQATYAEIITIQPPLGEGEDVSLYERTNVPLSSGPSLYAINTGPPGPGFDDFVSLIAFDLSDVELSANEVVNATLFLYENNVLTASFVHPTSPFPDQIKVEAAAGPWTPTGTFFSTIPEAVDGISTTTEVNSVNAWFEWDVTDIVKGWLDGSFENNGFIVSSSLETRTPNGVVGSAFDSFEQVNRPRLELAAVPEASSLVLLGATFASGLGVTYLRRHRS